jgi:hypothetical protein
VHVSPDALKLELGAKSSSDATKAALGATSDQGLGVTLIGRLAARMAWTIDETKLSEGRITIRFPRTESMIEMLDAH